MEDIKNYIFFEQQQIKLCGGYFMPVRLRLNSCGPKKGREKAHGRK